MNIEQSTVVAIKLTNIERLDPVTIYLEEFSKDAGRIVIHCWGKAWASFWPAMGGRGIAQFFVDCNNAYLAKNLDSETKSEIFDYEAFNKLLLKGVNEKLSSDLDEDDRYYFDGALSGLNHDSIPDDQKEGEFWCWNNAELLGHIFGGEWWEDIPKMANPDYTYLCRIIDVVREGLVEHLKTVEVEA